MGLIPSNISPTPQNFDQLIAAELAALMAAAREIKATHPQLYKYLIELRETLLEPMDIPNVFDLVDQRIQSLSVLACKEAETIKALRQSNNLDDGSSEPNKEIQEKGASLYVLHCSEYIRRLVPKYKELMPMYLLNSCY